MSKTRVATVISIVLGSLFGLSALTLLVQAMSAEFNVPLLIFAEMFVLLSLAFCAIGIRGYLTRMLASVRQHSDASFRRYDNRLSEIECRRVRDNDGVTSQLAALEQRSARIERLIHGERELLQVSLTRVEAAERRVVESVEASTFNTLDATDAIMRRQADQLGEAIRNSLDLTNRSIRELADRMDSRSEENIKVSKGVNTRLAEVQSSIVDSWNSYYAEAVLARAATEAASEQISKLAEQFDRVQGGLEETRGTIVAAIRRSQQMEGKIEADLKVLGKANAAIGNIDEMVSELRFISSDANHEIKDCKTWLESKLSSVTQTGDEMNSLFSELESTVRREVGTLVDAVKKMSEDNGAARADIFGQLNSLPSLIEKFRIGIEGTNLFDSQSWEEVRSKVDSISGSLSARNDQTAGELGKIRSDIRYLNELLSGMNGQIAKSHQYLAGSVTTEIGALRDSVKTVERLTDTTKNDTKALFRHVQRSSVDTVRQVEALLQLMGRVDSPSLRFPPSGGFAMNPDSLLLLSDLILNNKPRVILELGSGSSTVWTGYFGSLVGARCVSIEHLDEYFSKTMQQLLEFGLDTTVDLRHAPLEEVSIGGAPYEWYPASIFNDLGEVDLLIVDGPPEATGPNARYPAFPILHQYLSQNALILIDDIDRAQESEMVESWISNMPGLELTDLAASRTGVLRYRRK